MVSALRPEKGHDVAIEAVRMLRARLPNLRLLIVGQGAQHDAIAHASADLGDAVVMAGLRHDVMRVFDATDICLQPSHADAFPTTVIEAMAASVPVVASAIGGIPELVSDGRTGVLVPAPPDPEVVAAAVGRLLDQPDTRRRLAEAARLEYTERFTARPWALSTRALYDAVLANANGRRPRSTGAGPPHAELGRRRS